MRQYPPPTPVDLTVDATLDRLAKSPIAELRKQYRTLFEAEPPKAFGPDLLRRRIAQKLQEKTIGGLLPAARRQLNRLIQVVADKPNGKIELPRHIKSGSELVREWKGKTYRVTVKQDGFSYDDKSYASLSEIASHITGTNWNGPRFFGLRTKVEGGVANGK